MSAELELLQACREWRRLARAEAKAIRTHNWDLLADCQFAIKDYQSVISRLTVEARNEWEHAGLDCAARENHIQVFIHDLIETTRQNQALLQAAKNLAGEQLAGLGEAGRNLKLLQRSYGTTHVAGLTT